MRKINPQLSLTIADVFINLSAGWFGAAIILPAFSEKSFTFNLPILLFDITFGILSFVIAFRLRQIRRKR